MKQATQKIQAAYELAKERFATVGVDTEEALRKLDRDSHLHPLLAGR